MAVNPNINLFTSNETANGDAVNLGGSPVVVTEVFLEGSGALGDRVTSTAGLSGFICIPPSNSTVNMSTTGTHVGLWLWVTPYSILRLLQIVLSDRTGTSGGNAAASNYGGMDLTPGADYPALGGWYRVWADVSLFQSPDSTVGGWTSTDIANVGGVGALVEFFSSPGGSTENVIIDVIHYTNGSNPALVASGTSNTFNTFSVRDNNATAGQGQYGVFREIGGVYQCYSRIALSNTTATTFTDSNFTVLFVDQPLVSNSYMGIEADLTNASTSLSLTGGTVESVGTKRGDLIVTGTSGSLTITDCSLLRLRQITLTSGVEVNGGQLRAPDITQGGAYIHDGAIRTESAANVATIDDPTFGTTSGLSNVSFIQAGAGHAVQLNSTGPVTFTNIKFSGYGGTTGSNQSDGGNSGAAVFNNSGGAITITVDGGDPPSVFNSSGSTTTVLAAKTFTVTNIQADTELRIYSYTDLADPNTYTELAGIESVGTSTIGDSGFSTPVLANGVYSTTYSYDTSGGDIPIVLVAHNLEFEFFRQTLTLDSTENTSFTVFQVEDRQYDAGSV